MNESPNLVDLAEHLSTHVLQLASSPRMPDTPAHARARRYILEHLQQTGFTAREVPCRELDLTCYNVLTEPLPADERLPLVVVGAHYDTVSRSPGADDNASAVAALLELSRWVRPYLDSGRLHARLQLAAYDLEEYGLIGSDLHSQEIQAAGRPLRGMISLEMLGYTAAGPGSQMLPPHLAGLYPDVGAFIGVCANEASRELLGVVSAALQTVPGLPVESLAVPGDGHALWQTRLSDHSSFWDRGYPALMITDTSFFRNPHYHQASDTPETLDYLFLARVTAGVCRAVLELLGKVQPDGDR